MTLRWLASIAPLSGAVAPCDALFVRPTLSAWSSWTPHVESRLLDFQQHYEQIATPFEWKFTKNDLNALLERIVAPPQRRPALAA